MEHLVLLLVLLTVSSSYSSGFVYLVDSSNCVHIRCQWRGMTDYCKPKHSLREAFKRDRCGVALELLNKDETDADLIKRYVTYFPVNTFTIDNVDLGVKCGKKKKLCCNVEVANGIKDYDEYLKVVVAPQNGKQCKVQPMPYDI